MGENIDRYTSVVKDFDYNRGKKNNWFYKSSYVYVYNIYTLYIYKMKDDNGYFLKLLKQKPRVFFKNKCLR